MAYRSTLWAMHLNSGQLFRDGDLGADIDVAVYFFYIFIAEGDTAEGPVDGFVDQVVLAGRHSVDAYAAAYRCAMGYLAMRFVGFKFFPALRCRIVDEHELVPVRMRVFGQYVKDSLRCALVTLVLLVIPGVAAKDAFVLLQLIFAGLERERVFGFVDIDLDIAFVQPECVELLIDGLVRILSIAGPGEQQEETKYG